MWGEFSEATLNTLRAVLDRCHYRRTQRLAAFRTRRVYPLRDLWHAWKKPSLGAVSYPGAQKLPSDFRFFFCHEPLPEGLLTAAEKAALGEILGPEGCLVQVAAARDLYLMSSVPRRSPGEFVYLGDDTGMLLDWNRAARGRRALDMGTGCGAVALDLADRFESVLGVDNNPTAVAMARSNASLNRRPATFEPCDVWEGVSGRFDWITANLPALPIDPTPNLSFAAAGKYDPTVLTRRFFERLSEFLDGECRMLTFSPVDERGDRLFREADERLGKLSLEYSIQDEMPLSSRTFRKLRHVKVRVVNDGLGRRVRQGPPFWSRLALPILPAGAPLQKQKV